MTPLPFAPRIRALAERIDHMSLRERVLVFGAGVALVYVAWQSLLMDPLQARAAGAVRRAAEVRERSASLDAALLGGDPVARALERRQALSGRLAALEAELKDAAGGYVPPERMAELLRDVVDRQQGLRLVSLRNLPVESLADDAGSRAAAPGTPATAPPPDGPGPYVHPVELVVEGDYRAIVAYLHALEALPWRVQWRRLDLAAGDWPTNRVRIEIGTLGPSREWLSV